MKKKRRRNYIRNILLGVFISIAVYVSFTIFEQHREMKYLKDQEQIYAQEIKKMRKELIKLEEKLKNSSSDDFIERIAREQLKMIGKDEIIFIDMGKASQ